VDNDDDGAVYIPIYLPKDLAKSDMEGAERYDH
jgi:hypothetical protein